ncbi:MAG TPA: hypothetical protein VF070_11890 [Streptosporangiaceae bacterium]
MGRPARRRPALPGDAIDLHGAYVFGHTAKIRARRGEDKPLWAGGLDPLETLFFGAAWPEYYGDAYRFANACDTWLRVLRGTAYWDGIDRFVREALAVSREREVPLDADELYVPLRERLSVLGPDLRSLPRNLLPGEILRGARCFDGPARDIRLPKPPPNAEDLIKQFWAIYATIEFFGDGFSFFDDSGGTAFGGLMDGVRTLQAFRYQNYGPTGLLKGLYAGLVLHGELDLPGDVVNRAIAWALGLPVESPLVPIVDVLLIAVERGMEVEETLGHLFGVPAFGQPVSEADREWRSSTGTALRRVALELD